MWAVLAIGGYLIGSISFARIVGRWRAPDVDLSQVEYSVAGREEQWVYRGVSATSVTEKIGLRWGLLVVALDMSKGLVPTLITRLLWPDEPWYLIVGVMVVVGHVWPVWHRFLGGRGQSTLIGSLLVVSPISLPIAIIVAIPAGLLIFTSAHLAREGFGLYVWLWPLVWDGIGGTLWYGVAISFVYLAAIWPDLLEERRGRRSTEHPRSYRERLSAAWAEFPSDAG